MGDINKSHIEIEIENLVQRIEKLEKQIRDFDKQSNVIGIGLLQTKKRETNIGREIAQDMDDLSDISLGNGR